MEFEEELLNLLLMSPNSEKIQAIAEQLEIDHNFSFGKDRNDLQGVWELRWKSSESPYLNSLLLLIIFKLLIPLI